MTKLARTIPKLTFFALVLAALAVPASATISYSSCSSGCSDTAGTYSIWQSAPGSAGLTFSMSPATFAGGNLVSGVYTDPTGTVLTGYSSATNIDTLMSVSGSSLLQSVGGGGAGIEIQLPPNTYAVAFNITTLSGFGNPVIELGDHMLLNANYGMTIPSGGSVQFFSIISSSDAPLTELFVGENGLGGRLQLNDFEIGQESPTPEASTVALIGSGLLLFGLLSRRRIHKPHGAVA